MRLESHNFCTTHSWVAQTQKPLKFVDANSRFLEFGNGITQFWVHVSKFLKKYPKKTRHLYYEWKCMIHGVRGWEGKKFFEFVNLLHSKNMLKRHHICFVHENARFREFVNGVYSLQTYKVLPNLANNYVSTGWIMYINKHICVNDVYK